MAKKSKPARPAPKPKPKPKRPQPPEKPQPRNFAEEIKTVTDASRTIAEAQTDAATRANQNFQNQAQTSTQDIARNLDNDFTRAARQNLTAAQAGIDQVGAAATGLGQLRDSYAGQGPDPAMQRLNQQAAGQLYSPDQIRAGQVAADQVQGARVADIGPMQAARADAFTTLGASANAAQMGNIRDVQGPAGYTPDQIRAQQIAAAQSGPVQDVNAIPVGNIERVTGTRVASVAPMQSARVARTQDVQSRGIRASAAEQALMNEAQGGGLLGQLQDQAYNDLALGRSLSAEQSRDAIQSARAGMAARGLGTGNSALAAELLNRDRFATQREAERRAFAGNVLNQGTGIQQAANQAFLGRMEGNRSRDLQAALANQSVAANRASQNAQLRQQALLTNNQNEQQRVLADAGYAQQAGISNQDFAFRAASQDAQSALQAQLANQQAGLSLGQTNAQLLQQANLANQSTALQAGQLNQAANARAAEFQQQGGLQAALANQQTAFNTGQFNAANQQAANLQNAGFQQQANLANQAAFNANSQFNAGLQQQANAATFEAAQQRAMADAGYSQQAALSNQSANLTAAQYNVGQNMAAQQANQQANQAQEQYNRAFLGQVAGMNFDQNQARTSMLSGLYGQQAGLGQTTAALGQGMAQSQVALDPYQRALGSNMPIATISPSAGLVGQAYGNTLTYGQDLFNTNLNMQASMYNSFQNNQAALRGAGIQAGASAKSGQMGMLGAIGGGGLAAAGMIGGAVII